MSATFDYAVIRLVPKVERGEQINVGLVLYCQARDFLRARTVLDERRLAAFAPNLDLVEIGAALHAWETVCAGGHGPAAGMSLGERFRWLTSPRSTVVQTSPVHSGLTDDPAAELDRLLDQLVRV